MPQDLKQQPGKHSKISRRRRAMLPGLGNMFVGKLYVALGGQRRFPRLFKRAVAHGLSREHLEAVARQAKTSADLPRLLSGAGENHFQRGLYWHDVGVKSRARDHYLESALWFLYAAISATSPRLQAKALARCESSYLLAAPNFASPAELVAIQMPSGMISGYLRVPVPQVEAGESGGGFISTNYPCAILFNAVNAPKEELHLTENALLATGTATLSFDYPGYGTNDQAGELFNFSPDDLVNSLLLFLSGRSEIDMSRLAAYGTSLGGRLALYAAAKFPDRFRAVVSQSAPLDLLMDIHLLLPALQRENAVSANCSKAAIFDLARRTPLHQVLPWVNSALLAVSGSRDAIAMPEETRAIYEECNSTDKKLIVCAGAGHNCYEMMPSLRHDIAQWIRQRL
jgi:pimeloyl-ACP methyl ester carboxylesterase